METLFLILFVAAGIYLVRLNNDVKDMRKALMALFNQVSALDKEFEHFIKGTQSAVPQAESAFKNLADQKPPEKPIEDPAVEPVEETIEEPIEEPVEETVEEPIEETVEEPPYSPSPEPVMAETMTLETVEKDLSTRWMMWVGGIAFALGGAFLVKYSIDAGLLSPAVRVTLGTIIGLVMVGGGEALRVKHIKIDWLDGAPDYMPSAISAAGLFTAFAAIYAAHGIYEMVPPLLAFTALAGLSVLSSALALRQGRFFAYLGIIGGLVIPVLVQPGDSESYKLFPYLLIIIASALWVSRQRGWVDVPAVAVFLGIFWALTWIMTKWHTSDIIPLGGYLLTLGGLNTVMLRGATPARASDNSLSGLIPNHTITIISDLTTLLCVLLFVSIIRLEHYSATAMIMGALWLTGHAYAVSHNAENDGGGLISVFGILFLLVTWHIPDLFEIQQSLGENEALYIALMPIAPPGTEKFIITSIVLASAISASIFLWLPKLLRKSLWGSIAAALPIIILLINYWRIKDLEVSIPFAVVSMGLAGVLAFATMRIRRSDITDRTTLVATFAAGATSAVALAIAMLLRDAWLSFALTLEILALGYIWRATAVKGLRTLALFLATIVLVRLFLNASIFDYGGSESLPLINWLFYAYGLSSVIFYYAAKLFAQDDRDRLLSVLTAGSILLLISFITLEIHVLSVDNGKLSGIPTATEMALQTINWGVATTLLFWIELKHGDKLIGYLRRFMTLSSLFGILVGGGAANNIFLNPEVGRLTPIINIQFLQYFIPSALFMSKAWLAYIGGRSRSLKYYSWAAFFTLWYWLTAEVHILTVMLEGSEGAFNWSRYNYSTEIALQAIIWSAMASLLFWLGLKYADKLAGIHIDYMRYFVTGLSLLAVFIGVSDINNVFTNHNLGQLTPIINIQFLQYFIPAALFAATAWFAYKSGRDRSLKYYGGAAFVMAWYWVTAEVHVLAVMIDGLDGIVSRFPSELEVALQTFSWSVMTASLFWLELKHDNQHVSSLRQIMTLLSLLAVIVGGFAVNNIYINPDLGQLTPIINIQLLQYFIPAALSATIAWLAYTRGMKSVILYYGGATFVILWYWLTAEVHVFSTMLDGSQQISDWERYGYSIIWLLYAVALLIVGLKKKLGKIRMAGLFVLAIVVLKVFLIDMGNLEGLARALSFMGLGAALIGIGYLYQKLNQAEPIEAQGESTSE